LEPNIRKRYRRHVTNTHHHAIVIGGSIAGLLAARALADHFERVTIIERDHLPAGPQPRKGVPQASHVHVLLAKGLQVIESLLPGFSQALAADGAVPVNWGSDARTFGFTGWLPAFTGAPASLLCSRNLLEHHIRQRVLALPQVSVMQGADAVGLRADDSGRVTGLAIRSRDNALDALDARVIEADLIVDASGRSSKLPDWLSALGYEEPRETAVNSFLGYSSRLYRPPANFKADWKALLVRDRDAQHARGAGIYAIEGGQWLVNLGASGKAYPPTDNEGFLEFVRALPVPDLYDALVQAQPTSAINGYRRTENRWRHYERLKRMPDNVVALGDAACAFNPVYGQGMSIAALGAVELGQALERDSLRPGFALRFQRRLAWRIKTPWMMATSEDFRTPITEGGRPSWSTRLTHRYFDRVMAAVHDPDIHRAFMEVLQLLKPPATLFSPHIVWKALWGGYKQENTSRHTPAAGGEREARGPLHPSQQSHA
jgi:2-polyprenyl-6-methoxyphenol hydroxylase-like FAD-dependent oxidoreductase